MPPIPFLEDTVNLIIWSAVELAVTLICVGIPTVRPLYRTIVHGSHSESSEGKYVKPRYSRSDEEILVGQYGSSNDGIRVHEEVRVERTSSYVAHSCD